MATSTPLMERLARVTLEERQLVSITGMLHAPQLEKYWKTRFRTMEHFYEDVAQGTVSESYPHLIFEGFSTALGRRVVRVLQHLWPPREAVGPSSKKDKLGSRVITFKNVEDVIEVRHHVFVQSSYNSVELAEVGPRMTMRLFEIRGGTLENKEGDVEWRLSQYTRTSKKKDYL